MVCRYCGYVLDPFAQNCPRCAYLSRTGQTALPPNPAALPPPSAPLPPAQTVTLPTGEVCKICPVCQQPAVLNKAACGRCGYAYFPPQNGPLYAPASAALAAAPLPYGARPGIAPTASAGSDRQIMRLSLYAVGVLLSLGVCLASVRLLSPSSKTNKATPFLTVLPSRNITSGSFVGKKIETGQIEQRLLSAKAITGGEIEVSLAWNSLTDLDLEVGDASGELISADHPTSASGGIQDVDANPTLLTTAGSQKVAAGQPPDPQDVLPLPEFMIDMDKKFGLPAGTAGMGSLDGHAPPRITRSPIEHIYFAHAPKGTYTVYAHCYSWREPNALPLPFTIQIRSHGQVFYETAGTLGPKSFVSDRTVATQICQFVVR